LVNRGFVSPQPAIKMVLDIRCRLVDLDEERKAYFDK
jgi:hypothetical protein